MPELQNDLLLRAARGEPTERTPVWMMRQAGRYLPEYRALRAEEAFFDVCRTPELAAEVTIQPVVRFPVDAAIIFSDILVVPQAMGCEVTMVKGEGPVFTRPLDSPADLDRLDEPDVSRDLKYVYDAVALVRQRLASRIPLIGFCGGPWTLAAYMIEGGGSKSFLKSRSWLFRYPSAAHELLDLLTDSLVDHLSGQVRAGVQALQVFDTWAGLLGPPEFETFALPRLWRIGDEVKRRHPDVPLIVFAKGAHFALEKLSHSAYDVVGLDWSIDPTAARKVMRGRAALQGNLDPAVLFAEPDVIRREVRRMLTAFGTRGHIANLGHGMHPDHDPERAGVFVDAVHAISEEIRESAGIEHDA